MATEGCTKIIHNQLQKEEMRFILIGKKNKIPLEKNWQEKANYKHDDPKLLNHISKGGNVGCATGFGNTVVIDFDNEELQNKTIKLLPATFTTMSGGGLLHKWFVVDKPESYKVLDEEMNTLCDIQGQGKQVIIPPSVHPNGTPYTIFDDSNIAAVTMAEIKALFSEHIKKKPTKEKKQFSEKDSVVNQIKTKLTVKEMLNKCGVDTNKNPTKCPLHGSKGGKCLSFKDNLWHCFHCENGGDVFNLYQEVNGVDFVTAKKELAKQIGIETQSHSVIKIDNYKVNAKILYDIMPYFYDTSEIWWLWNEDHWDMSNEVDMKRFLDSHLGFQGQTISSGLRNNHLEAMKWTGRENQPKPSKTHWIQFKDKAFSLTSKKTYKCTPKYFFTNPIPHDVAESPETPFFDTLFEQWVGKAYVQDLYEIIAYCTYTGYPIQTIICLHGNGRNGKSCFFTILKEFLGVNNICSTELDLLVGNNASRFETSKLYKKLACLMGETNFGSMSKSSMLKKLVGGDFIGIEMKGKQPIDTLNYAKVLVASNSLPTSYDTSDGFYRRWHIIDFPNQFKEGVDVFKDIPEGEYNRLAKKVTQILPKLLERGSFTNQGSISQRKDKYIMASNPLPFFLKNFCIEEDNSYTYVSYGELYTAYCLFLKGNKKRKVSMKEFRSSLEDEGHWVERTTKNMESNRWIEGVKLKEGWQLLIHTTA